MPEDTRLTLKLPSSKPPQLRDYEVHWFRKDQPPTKALVTNSRHNALQMYNLLAEKKQEVKIYCDGQECSGIMMGGLP